MNWSVYILECMDGSYYTGISTDVTARFKVHASGKGSKYVKSRGAKRIIFKTEAASKSEALKLEYKIKQLSKVDKIKLVREKPLTLFS